MSEEANNEEVNAAEEAASPEVAEEVNTPEVEAAPAAEKRGDGGKGSASRKSG